MAENCLTGNPESEWRVSGAGAASIQGFATDISVNKGNTISFKVKTDPSSYRIDIYRVGYYSGNGARKVATINHSVSLPQNQPACITDASTGLIDCGNWTVSASWAVPASTSAAWFDRIASSERATSCLSFETTTAPQTCSTKLQTLSGRLTTITAATAFTSVHPPAAPTRSVTTAHLPPMPTRTGSTRDGSSMNIP